MVYRTLGGDATLACPAFTVALAADAIAAARALTLQGGPEPVPIRQMTDDLAGEAARATVAAGADGVDYLSFRAGHESYLASARAARAG